MSTAEIDRLIEDYINLYYKKHILRIYKKPSKRKMQEYKREKKESIIQRATELSETGILTLESVRTAIKESEDDHEEFMKYMKEGPSALLYIIIWAILTFLLTLVVNLAFWGILTGGNTSYWGFLFNQGLWTFLVGGIGALMIILYFYYEVF